MTGTGGYQWTWTCGSGINFDKGDAMKKIMEVVKNSKGVVMLITIIVILSVTALGVAMITNAALSSTMAKNYRNKIQSFYAADGQMTVLAQTVLDSNEANWLPKVAAGGGTDTAWPVVTSTCTDSQASTGPSKAYDGNTGTRFTTSGNTALPNFIQLDLGQSRSIYKVSIWPYTGSGGTRYQYFNILIDGTQVGGNDTLKLTQAFQDFTFTSTTGRFVKISDFNTSPASKYLGIWEMKVIGTAVCSTIVNSQKTDTAAMGQYKVQRFMQMVGLNRFSLATKAYDSTSKWGVVFETPLKQYIERQSSMLLHLDSTMKLPVTYYDYHSNNSNPDFNPGTDPGGNASNQPFYRHTVADTLDLDSLPIRGTNCLWTHYINKWFRPWPQSQRGQLSDSVRPKYDGTGHSYLGDTIVKYDTSYKNIVINDSLTFKLIDSIKGIYQINIQGTFFPIDGKGFKYEGRTRNWDYFNYDVAGSNRNLDYVDTSTNKHNYSFAMHLKTTFTYRPGLNFAYQGDDDMWTYINNKLVLDLGGMPHNGGDSILLDTLATRCGLITGNKAIIDVFYDERQATGSNIKITTNILNYRPITSRQRHWTRDYGSLQ